MKKNLFLAFALVLFLFAVSACGGGGGGGGSSDPYIVINNLPPGGLKWKLNISKLPILGQPTFAGGNFIALGENPSKTENGVDIFTGGYGNNEKHVYESPDGINWQDTTTINAPNLNAEDSYMRVRSGTVYLPLSYDSSPNYLQRIERGKWVEKSYNEVASLLRYNGISYGLASGGDAIYPSGDDSPGIPMIYEPDPEGFSLDKNWFGDYFYGPNDEFFRIRRFVKNTSAGSWAKVLLYHAPYGEPNLKLMKNFPDLKEPTDNPHKLLFSGLGATYGRGLYLVGVGNWIRPDSTGYGPRFYTSTDLNSWSQVQGLPDFSKLFTVTADTTVYELGSMNYLRGLFIIFIDEGTYSSNGVFNQIACHVVTSTDLQTFGSQRFANVDCKYGSIYYVNGRFVLTAKKEAGKRGDSAGSTVYRIVTLTVSP